MCSVHYLRGKHEARQGWAGAACCWGAAHRSAPLALTHKAELVGEHLEESITVHGKQDGEVGGEAAPDEEVVDSRPEARVQPDLVERGRKKQGSGSSCGVLSMAMGQDGTQAFTSSLCSR